MLSLVRAASALLLLTACAPSLQPPAGGAGAAAGRAAVEQFLRLSKEANYTGMGFLFGNTEGPIISRDPRPDVERRMYALAAMLQHESFVVQDESVVPGRSDVAVKFSVRLMQRGKPLVVPFVAVRGPDQRWFVEDVGTTVLMSH